MRITRTSSPYLDSILGDRIPILDHGFIRVIDYMGDDAAIVQAARVSYGAGTKTVNEDRGLINYLMKHRHTSPFEMCELKIHAKMPIFVARQWVRHRMASLNEISGRYSKLDNEFYIPDAEQVCAQATNNKQGRADAMDPQIAEYIRGLLSKEATSSYTTYEALLESGLAKELARMNLSLNTYTQWYWKIDLHNLLHFLKLRCDKHAQYEIRVYADAIYNVLKGWVPLTAAAAENYLFNSVTFSREQLEVLQHFTSTGHFLKPDGMSDRDYNEVVVTTMSE